MVPTSSYSARVHRPCPQPSAAPRRSCRLAVDAAEFEAHYAVRRHVFVQAQGLFDSDDRDAHDGEPGTLHAVGLVGERVGGAVRLYPQGGAGRWFGDRLAVLPEHRTCHLGALLVRFAVRTAAERGGSSMSAQIQTANIVFFEGLGWRCAGPEAPFHGSPHQPMIIDLRSGA